MCLYTCSYRCNVPVNSLNSISVQVKERRFKDAAQLCRTWALEILEEVAEASRNNLPQEEEKRRYKEYCEHKENADLYYAYSFIDQSISEPFRTTMPEILFNIARFLLSRCTMQTPQGISLVNILVTLAEHSRDLGCYKVARHAYGRLQCLQVPDSWVDKLEVATLAVRAKAGGGCEETAHMSIDIPMCYSCSSPLPLVSQSSDDTCSVCLQPFFRSFLTFDHIPLVSKSHSHIVYLVDFLR
jgi:intraflagellar transport protein 122